MVYHSKFDTHAYRRLMAHELAERLSLLRFHYFVTLSTNHRPVKPEAMRRFLREWDARLNRYLVGPRWHRRPDERLLWYAFLEKSDTNPHWHLIVQLDPAPPSSGAANRQGRFRIEAMRQWNRLVPTGSVDAKTVASQGVIEYCAKELWSADSFSHFILSREFQNR